MNFLVLMTSLVGLVCDDASEEEVKVLTEENEELLQKPLALVSDFWRDIVVN